VTLENGEARTVDWSLKSRQRLVDEIVAELRHRIYEGTYQPGSLLRQEKLSTEFGVSRTPIREALKMLEQEGLIVAELGHGVKVVTGDRQTLLAAYELRAVTDGLAARLAAQRISTEGVKSLREIIAKQRSVLEPFSAVEYTRLNVFFHQTIIHEADNEFMTAQIPILRMTAQVFAPVKLVDQSVAANAVGQHQDIFTAIEKGDSKEAEQLSRDHIETTIRRLQGEVKGNLEEELG
jgi:DNA-binding GntR family transcriptional regulator